MYDSQINKLLMLHCVVLYLHCARYIQTELCSDSHSFIFSKHFILVVVDPEPITGDESRLQRGWGGTPSQFTNSFIPRGKLEQGLKHFAAREPFKAKRIYTDQLQELQGKDTT